MEPGRNRNEPKLCDLMLIELRGRYSEPDLSVQLLHHSVQHCSSWVLARFPFEVKGLMVYIRQGRSSNFFLFSGNLFKDNFNQKHGHRLGSMTSYGIENSAWFREKRR
jgi:hypothetical protein